MSAALMLAIFIGGCTTQQRSPDNIREQTAKATHDATQDAKAAVQGVIQGLKEKGPVNINKAPVDDLKSLPGVTDETAQRIVAHRPYDSGADLVKRHIVSRSEYSQIADKITTR